VSGFGTARVGVRFRPADPTEDAALLHGWFQAEHVAPWWGLVGPLETTREYLDANAALEHQRAWVATDDDGPLGYVETYLAAEDPLAAHYPAQPGDRGWHVLVGDAGRLGTGATRRLGVAVLSSLLGEDDAARVVCEPDVRNHRMLGWCGALGGRELDRFPFGAKTAALITWSRDQVAGQWADDVRTAGEAGRSWDRMDGSAA